MSTVVAVPVDGRRDVLTRTFRHARDLASVLPCQSLVEHFDEHVDDGKRFFADVLPAMQSVAAELPRAIPLLKAGVDARVTLTQSQVLSILSNAFFCLFDDAPTRLLPSVNMGYILAQSSQREKLKTLLHYFARAVRARQNRLITFHRRALKHFPAWKTSSERLTTQLVVQTEGRIEDCDPTHYVHADFANKLIGCDWRGKACAAGFTHSREAVAAVACCRTAACKRVTRFASAICLAERLTRSRAEIYFLVHPECIAARLFVETIGDNEAVVISGVERYCTYAGYGSQYTFTVSGRPPHVNDADAALGGLCRHVPIEDEPAGAHRGGV